VTGDTGGSVLITGTTSGIGRALREHYAASGRRVIAVDRRESPDGGPLVERHIVDIAREAEVRALLGKLEAAGSMPAIFVLNAGINEDDNADGFAAEPFRRVLETNLFGVTSFLDAIAARRLEGRTILALSSTSNIVPNPGRLAYYVSKLSLQRIFGLLRATDPANDYRVAILGPVHTNISAKGAPLTGIQKRVFDALAVDAPTAARRIARFLAGSRRTLYFTPASVAFYWAIRAALVFLPGLYRGSAKPGTRLE
jgi:NAD(P)-dependent dehydrogenase (short-subunit alcohol dehydrogenase family)